jgi:hypothetical protein
LFAAALKSPAVLVMSTNTLQAGRQCREAMQLGEGCGLSRTKNNRYLILGTGKLRTVLLSQSWSCPPAHCRQGAGQGRNSVKAPVLQAKANNIRCLISGMDDLQIGQQRSVVKHNTACRVGAKQ